MVILRGFVRSLKITFLYVMAILKPYSMAIAFIAGSLGAAAVVEADYTKVHTAEFYWWLVASLIGYIVAAYFYEREMDAVALQAMEYAYTKDALIKVVAALCEGRGADNVGEKQEPPKDA